VKYNYIRTGVVAALAAVTLGVMGSAACAANAEPLPGEAAAAATTLTEREAAQQLATNLLKYEGERFTDRERAELQAIADGKDVDRSKLDGLIRLLQKVKGFAKAVKGSYAAFQAWYNKLPWYVKGPLTAAGVGSDLYSIWQAFH
jgi:hypothetical protein